MAKIGNRSRTVVNLICSIAVFITNFAINFVLSPYIVRTIGVEANGFVTLASNFITYAQLIVTALNSMAGRFIMIEYVKKDFKKANLYYNSVFWGNLIIVAVLIIPAIVLILKFESFFDVPDKLITDVKLLFSFIFLNFFLTTGAPNWSGAYISNRLDRTYIPTSLSTVLKGTLIFLSLTLIAPKIFFIGLATTIYTVIILAVNCYNTHKLTPELKVVLNPKKLICSMAAIKELVGAGIWNSISSIGNILLSGLDLVIANLFFGATEMGVISLSKTLPHFIQQLSVSVREAFAPELTINYANNDIEAVKRDLNRAMKMTSILLTIPIAGIIVLGDRFFELWVPTQDAQLLQKLSILAIFGYIFTSGTQILYNVFTTVNKVKTNSIMLIISGLVSTGTVFIFAKFTDYGLYAVAGASTVVNLIRNMVYTVPFTAKYLGFKWYQFFPQVLTTVFSSVVLVGVGFLIKSYLPSGSWLMLFVSAFILGVIGLIFNIGIVLNKDEKRYLFSIVKSKIMKVFR